MFFKLLLLAVILYVLYNIAVKLYDFFVDHIIPLLTLLSVVFIVGSFLYMFVTETWAAAETLEDYLLFFGQLALILGAIAFYIWSIFSETGGMVYRIVRGVIITGIVLYIGIYSFIHFGGIYGIIADIILAVVGYGLFNMDEETARTAYGSRRAGHQYTSNCSNSCMTCSNKINCKYLSMYGNETTRTCRYHGSSAYDPYNDDLF